MKRELLSKALGEIDSRFVAEAYRPHTGSGPERSAHMRRKRIVTLALAAALILALGAAAYAVNQAVGSPQAARRVALQEIERWKELGLLNPAVSFEGEPRAIHEIQEQQGTESWYGRLFPHHYDVRWYVGPIRLNGDEEPEEVERHKYGCNLSIDTLSGKIMAASIDAMADEDDVPVWETTWKEPIDPQHPEAGSVDREPMYFYNNFEDIFPADMTVGRFCELLAQYWGFTGYRLAETVDAMYFDEPQPPADPDTLLKDMTNSHPGENYYLTVFFEGDQPGAPMYIQLHQFPGFVTLMLGTVHAVG